MINFFFFFDFFLKKKNNSGGNVTQGTPCIITASVIGVSEGSFVNPSFQITSMTAESTPRVFPIATTADAPIVVIGPPRVTKVYFPDTVALGEGTSLLISIENRNSMPMTGVSFVDSLPFGPTRNTSGPIVTSVSCSGFNFSSSTATVRGKPAIFLFCFKKGR